MVESRHMSASVDNVRTLVRFRWLLYELVLRDVKLRYRGSLLGVYWTLLNPLLCCSFWPSTRWFSA
jgi:ABC-type polysaccharide/polyol phosphate export permease